jgi:hypothetical protein
LTTEKQICIIYLYKLHFREENMSDNLAIFNKNHVMVDCETLSTHQNAVIVSIGAVKFSFEDGLKEEFLVNIDVKDSVKNGFHIEQSTVDWWKKQPLEVRQAWTKDPQPVKESIAAFNEFIGTDTKQLIWCLGAAFDFGIVRNHLERFDMKRNWAYWSECDVRTVFTLLGIRNDKIRKTQSGYHSALEDAKAQTLTLIDAFK